MRDAFQECIDNIDRHKQREDGEEGAMIRVIVRLVIFYGDIAFTRKEKQRTKIKNGRRDQNKNKKEKGPILFKAPAVENPPGNHEKEENVQDPHRMEPNRRVDVSALAAFRPNLGARESCPRRGQWKSEPREN